MATKTKKKSTKKVKKANGFSVGDYVVYPTHGVGRITGIEEQEIVGMKLELFIVEFDKDPIDGSLPYGRKFDDDTLSELFWLEFYQRSPPSEDADKQYRYIDTNSPWSVYYYTDTMNKERLPQIRAYNDKGASFSIKKSIK